MHKEFSTFKTEIERQMKKDYEKITLNLNNIFQIISTKESPGKPMTVSPKSDLLQNLKLPLSSCDEIAALEMKIRNNLEFKTQLIGYLSKIGGCTGKEDGSKIAYKVVDCVFNPAVLMQYSWTGVSRGKSVEKKPFQILEGILGVFYEVLLLADSRHTKMKNCSYFKDGVLKHAKKRTARKRTKAAEIDPLFGNEQVEVTHTYEQIKLESIFVESIDDETME